VRKLEGLSQFTWPTKDVDEVEDKRVRERLWGVRDIETHARGRVIDYDNDHSLCSPN
jgi:hypothetical protein